MRVSAGLGVWIWFAVCLARYIRGPLHLPNPARAVPAAVVDWGMAAESPRSRYAQSCMPTR